MNKKRLLKMADFVETIPRKDFAMEIFGETTACGTVGCALGWAAHTKLFRGLRQTTETYLKPAYRGRCGFDAAEVLFDISRHQVEGLFRWHTTNETPKQVARNIRRFVESNGEVLP
jgi:hypothetical protein